MLEVIFRKIGSAMNMKYKLLVIGPDKESFFPGKESDDFTKKSITVKPSTLYTRLSRIQKNIRELTIHMHLHSFPLSQASSVGSMNFPIAARDPSQVVPLTRDSSCCELSRIEGGVYILNLTGDSSNL